MNETQKQIFQIECPLVAEILAASPYMDSNTRKRVAEFSQTRYPSYHKIVEKVADQHLKIPKGEEFPFVAQIVREHASNSDLEFCLQASLLPSIGRVERDLYQYQAPYNAINIQRNLINKVNVYLSYLYKITSKFLLDDIREKFPELCDQTNEMLLLNKIYAIEENDSPSNFNELISFAKNKHDQGIANVVSTGFKGIDQKINENGYSPKRLTVLEAKTGLGKTSFISQTLSTTALKHHQGVLLLSFEMDSESLMYRMLSQATQIPAKDIAQMLESALGPTNEVEEAIKQLDKFVLIKYPDNTGDISYIENQILSYTRLYGRVPALVVVDYIQQLSMERTNRFSSMSDELTAISRNIRGFAQRYQTHIIVTSQVMETSDGGARAFGASGIEFSADHVLVLAKSPTDENKRILKFKKNRFGPSGDEIELFWNSKTTSFFELNTASYATVNLAANHTFPFIDNFNSEEGNQSGDRIVF